MFAHVVDFAQQRCTLQSPQCSRQDIQIFMLTVIGTVCKIGTHNYDYYLLFIIND